MDLSVPTRGTPRGLLGSFTTESPDLNQRLFGSSRVPGPPEVRRVWYLQTGTSTRSRYPWTHESSCRPTRRLWWTRVHEATGLDSRSHTVPQTPHVGPHPRREVQGTKCMVEVLGLKCLGVGRDYGRCDRLTPGPGDVSTPGPPVGGGRNRRGRYPPPTCPVRLR